MSSKSYSFNKQTQQFNEKTYGNDTSSHLNGIIFRYFRNIISKSKYVPQNKCHYIS